MTIAHLLEDFAPGAHPFMWQSDVLDDDAAEIKRLEAYEEGYKAGWDDAVSANQSEQLQVAADLAQNLRDMSFTYQEACAHVTASLQTVFDEMMTHFLPRAARASLASKVREEIESLPLGADNMKVAVHVAPENLGIMQRLTEDFPDHPPKIVADETLTCGQAMIGFQDTELSIDFDALLAQIQEALEMVTHPIRKDAINE